MNKAVSICLVVFGFLMSSAPGYCGEDEKVYAVQKKIFHTFHELGLDLGYISSEDFFEVFPVGFHYSYSFSDLISWEVIRYQQAFTRSKSLKKDLQNDFGVKASLFTEPKFYAHSQLVFKPLYGKSALLNKKIINQETSFLLGLGVENFERTLNDERVVTENALSLSIGVGTKYFINKRFAVNMEIRDLVNFRNSKTENIVYMGLGITYRFNLSPRQADPEEDTEKVRKYLKNEVR